MKHFLRRRAATFLLLVLVVGAVTAPLRDDSRYPLLSFLATYLVIGLAGAYLMVPKKGLLVAYLVSAFLMIALRSLAETVPSGSVGLAVAAAVFTFGTLGLLLYFVINYSLLEGKIPKLDRIVAGICGYLLVGFAWASLMTLLELVVPGSFIDHTDEVITPSDLTYNSLVTLTTLGYGDVVPVSRMARILCALEAVFGTLYIAIFISSLLKGSTGRAA